MSGAHFLDKAIFDPAYEAMLVNAVDMGADVTYPEESASLSVESYAIHRTSETRTTRKIARAAGATVRFTFEEPHPDNLVTETVAVVLNGFTAVEGAYEDVRHRFALRGQRCLTLEHDRIQNLVEAIQPRTHSKPALALCRAAGVAMRTISEEKEVEMFDLVGHSMGGFIATNVARHRPNRIRSLSLVATAGGDGHDLAELIHRAPDVTRDLFGSLRRLPPHMRRLWFREAIHILSNPLRLFEEAIAVGNCDIRKQVHALGESGILTAAYQYEDDGFFPVDEQEKKLKPVVKSFRKHPDPTLGHLGPQIDPDGLVEMIQTTSQEYLTAA